MNTSAQNTAAKKTIKHFRDTVPFSAIIAGAVWYYNGLTLALVSFGLGLAIDIAFAIRVYRQWRGVAK